MTNKLTLSIIAGIAILHGACNNVVAGTDIQTPPHVSEIGIMGDIITIIFNKTLSSSLQADKITVKLNRITLKPGTDYVTGIKSNTLIIKLETPPAREQKYTVDLKTGVVKSKDGQNSKAAKAELTTDIEPALIGSPSFSQNSDTELTINFDKKVKIIDQAKIKLLGKTPDEQEFTEVPISQLSLSKYPPEELKITLKTAASDGNKYRIVVGFGGVKSGDMFNNQILNSEEVMYSTLPIPNSGRPPYILDNKLIVTFNMNITLKDCNKIKLFHIRRKLYPERTVELRASDCSIKRNNKTQLEIKLPYTDSRAIYRLQLKSGAISEYEKPDNENEPIAPEKIKVQMEPPAILIDGSPYMKGNKIIVSFNKEIKILKADGIGYKFKEYQSLKFQPLIIPTEPARLVTGDKSSLEITLNKIPKIGQVYCIYMETGAIGGINIPNSVEINNPYDKDITISSGASGEWRNAVFKNKKEFSVYFHRDIKILDANAIQVQTREESEKTFTPIPVQQRKIKVDNITEKGKIDFTLEQDTEMYTQYWQVIFPPGSILDLENRDANRNEIITEETIVRLSDTNKWKEIKTPTNSGKWSPRRNHTSVVFNPPDDNPDRGEMIWVLGGYDDSYLKDVWNSKDGASWYEVTGNAIWEARESHTSVVFDEKIWVIGGQTVYGAYNDVWNSKDGVDWEVMAFSADWEARHSHSSVVFNKKIWIMAGYNRRVYNDVWSSKDGFEWIEESDRTTIPWHTRYNHSSTVFNDKIWITEGSYYSLDRAYRRGSWYSEDGINWSQKYYPLSTPYYYEHSSVVFENRLWNLLGRSNTTRRPEKHIYSIDNIDGKWVKEKNTYQPKANHSSVVFDDGNGKKIWILGGEGPYKDPTNEVWSFGKQES